MRDNITLRSLRVLGLLFPLIPYNSREVRCLDFDFFQKLVCKFFLTNRRFSAGSKSGNSERAGKMGANVLGAQKFRRQVGSN